MSSPKASVVTAMRLTGRAVPNVLVMAMPWVALSMAVGIGGHMQGQAETGWQMARFVTSIGASAILVTCAGIYLKATPLPYRTALGCPLLRYLLWWLPLAGTLLAMLAQNFAIIIGVFAIFFVGRLSMAGLGDSPGDGAPESWRFAQVFRASLGTLACFLLTPAIILILMIPVIGAIGLAGVDVGFLEDDPLSRGGSLTSGALASEFFAALVPHLAASTVGFYQGALLLEWRANSRPA